MLGKTFKGLTDEMLAWQTQALLEREIARDDYTVRVRPEIVVEIAFNDVQTSPQYPAGTRAAVCAREGIPPRQACGRGRYDRDRPRTAPSAGYRSVTEMPVAQAATLGEKANAAA
jgi:ATP-dependent DNA ligase